VKKYILFIFFGCLLLLILLIGAEFIARSKGFKPWKWQIIDRNEPAMFQPDPVLGWTVKSGKYLLPAPDSQVIQYTFLKDGSRITSPDRSGGPYDVLALGCSYTEGWAVNDNQTFAWKLAEAFPFLRVANYGRGGYGTYQSLLLLRELFKEGAKPSVVLYGFFDHHEWRNVAPILWVQFLSEFSHRGHVAVPYCSIDKKGRLMGHPPWQYPVMPWREYFALPQFLVSNYNEWIKDDREKYKNMITKWLLLEMNNLSIKNGARFIVIFLDVLPEARNDYRSFLKAAKIEMIDANLAIGGEYAVPWEGHPNEKAHSYWASEIVRYLDGNIQNIKNRKN
jgi:hypothetical protein